MKNGKPIIYVVLGVHNELKYLKQILACFDVQTYKNYKMVIVDDGSKDGTDIYVKKNYPKAILIKGNGNLWWTGVIHLGVEEIFKIARTNDFIFIINNDCIFNPNLLSTLLLESFKHKHAIVGSIAIDLLDKQTLTDAGVIIDWSKGRLIALGPKYLREISKTVDIIEVDTLSTKGTLYPVKVFREVGNFDKKHLPHYVSDYEFSIRAKKRGYKLLLNYRARIYNETSRTGIGNEMPININLTKVFELLFTRKSRMNIIDHFWFITLCCPLKYKAKNYFLLLFKPLYMFKVLLLSKIKYKN